VSKLIAAIQDDLQEVRAEEHWRTLLTDGDAKLVRARHIARHLPSAPRCKVCSNPFRGIGGRALGLAGFSPSPENPSLCARCCEDLPVGGGQVDVAVLAADIRGSTTLGERVLATDFARLLKEFYSIATRTLLRRDAVIDKLIGDDVLALFFQGISGDRYRQRAIEAGRDLLCAVGYASQPGSWLQLGVTVTCGPAYVGNVRGDVVDFTAIGDTVDLATRMQSAAAAGELVVAAGVDDQLLMNAPRRTLAIPGRSQPVEAFVLRADSNLKEKR
jgi:adenylate cyclase